MQTLFPILLSMCPTICALWVETRPKIFVWMAASYCCHQHLHGIEIHSTISTLASNWRAGSTIRRPKQQQQWRPICLLKPGYTTPATARLRLGREQDICETPIRSCSNRHWLPPSQWYNANGQRDFNRALWIGIRLLLRRGWPESGVLKK